MSLGDGCFPEKNLLGDHTLASHTQIVHHFWNVINDWHAWEIKCQAVGGVGCWRRGGYNTNIYHYREHLSCGFFLKAKATACSRCVCVTGKGKAASHPHGVELKAPRNHRSVKLTELMSYTPMFAELSTSALYLKRQSENNVHQLDNLDFLCITRHPKWLSRICWRSRNLFCAGFRMTAGRSTADLSADWWVVEGSIYCRWLSSMLVQRLLFLSPRV